LTIDRSQLPASVDLLIIMMHAACCMLMLMPRRPIILQSLPGTMRFRKFKQGDASMIHTQMARFSHVNLQGMQCLNVARTVSVCSCFHFGTRVATKIYIGRGWCVCVVHWQIPDFSAASDATTFSTVLYQHTQKSHGGVNIFHHHHVVVVVIIIIIVIVIAGKQQYGTSSTVEEEVSRKRSRQDGNNNCSSSNNINDNTAARE
jgi:hypothetical protein